MSNYLRTEQGKLVLDKKGQPIPENRNRSPGNIVRPPCPVHGDTMRCGSTGTTKRYWYCCVLGCKESRPRAREKIST